MNQTPTTRFVFRARTTCGRPTTRILESSVAMKMPTVVTVRTIHLYSKDNPARLPSVSEPPPRGIKRPREMRPPCCELRQYTDTRPEQYLIKARGRCIRYPVHTCTIPAVP